MKIFKEVSVGFKLMMTNYVISLKNQEIRRRHIQNEFAKNELVFEFFDAITPDSIDLIEKHFNLTFSQQDLTETEIACFLSHICVWVKILERDENAAVVFEDDIYLSSDTKSFLETKKWLPYDTDIMKIEKTFPKSVGYIFSKKATIHNRNIIKLKNSYSGTGGYIITKEGIIKILKLIKNIEISLPIDHYIFDKLILERKINVYQLLPTLCIQDCILNKENEIFESTISADRFNRKAEKRTLISRLKRDFNNLFRFKVDYK